MKKILLAMSLAVTACIGFTSCSSDESEDDVKQSYTISVQSFDSGNLPSESAAVIRESIEGISETTAKITESQAVASFDEALRQAAQIWKQNAQAMSAFSFGITYRLSETKSGKTVKISTLKFDKGVVTVDGKKM